MPTSAPQFLLASRSPRRAALLASVGLRFDIVAADVEEARAPGQTPHDYALATALAKARAGAARQPGLAVLGADTDVVLDDAILGKPHDRAHALEMLARLSNRAHDVFSAVALVNGGRELTVLSVTRVEFGPIAPAAAAAYWDTGEPADKAGAYAIQGGAARWVRRIEGSYTGVVGLPLFETLRLLASVGVQPP
ncbi:MAG: septum formation inhibitor Maf [Nevskiaceae bacterium]|nr:MAG: septum formation inhibitor Maf [Nevskiaceae bacterium]TBR72751.1 MAG: septum formation inhibitor Maf [Nevskiaceae bacterium]